MGLRTRIAAALSVIFAGFILLTEFSVMGLVRTSFDRQNIPQSTELHADLIALQNLVMFYMILGAVIAVAIGTYVVTRLVVRPLGNVTKAVEEVAEGQLDTEVPIKGSGELVRLGIAFNRMTKTLSNQRSELEQRLSALETAKDRLIRSAKLATVGTLSAGIAHEIGNPLAGVLGLLEAAETETNSELLKKYRQLMRTELGRIDRVIRELLAYARPSNQEDDTPQSSSLSQVKEHLEALLTAQKAFDRVELEWVLPDDLPPVAVSEDELSQMLVNLTMNAAQAMQNKGKITVTAFLAQEDDIKPNRMLLEIQDDGPGIPKDLATRIFEPFFTTKPTGEGSGLGLAICQAICDRRGAEILLDNEVTKGTRITLELPTA